jgi:hypothetical protein
VCFGSPRNPPGDPPGGGISPKGCPPGGIPPQGAPRDPSMDPPGLSSGGLSGAQTQLHTIDPKPLCLSKGISKNHRTSKGPICTHFGRSIVSSDSIWKSCVSPKGPSEDYLLPSRFLLESVFPVDDLVTTGLRVPLVTDPFSSSSSSTTITLTEKPENPRAGTPGVPQGDGPGVPQRVSVGIPRGIPWGGPWGTPWGIPWGIPWEIRPGIARGIPQEIPREIPRGIPLALPNYVATYVLARWRSARMQLTICFPLLYETSSQGKATPKPQGYPPWGIPGDPKGRRIIKQYGFLGKHLI